LSLELYTIMIETKCEEKPLLVLFAGEMKSRRMWESFTPETKELFDFVTIDPHVPEEKIDIPCEFNQWTPLAKAQWKYEWTMNHVGEDTIMQTLKNNKIPVVDRRIIFAGHDIVTTTKDRILEKPNSIQQVIEDYLPLYECEDVGLRGAWYLQEYMYPERKGILLYEYDGVHLSGSSDTIRTSLLENPSVAKQVMKDSGGWSLKSDTWSGIWSGRMYIGDGVHDSFNPHLQDYSERSVTERDQLIYGTQGQIMNVLLDSSMELMPPFGVIYEPDNHSDDSDTDHARFIPFIEHPIFQDHLPITYE
jgi:hypothetical protein